MFELNHRISNNSGIIVEACNDSFPMNRSKWVDMKLTRSGPFAHPLVHLLTPLTACSALLALLAALICLLIHLLS